MRDPNTEARGEDPWMQSDSLPYLVDLVAAGYWYLDLVAAMQSASICRIWSVGQNNEKSITRAKLN